MDYTELIAQIRDALSVTHPRDDLDLELVRQAAAAIEALQGRCNQLEKLTTGMATHTDAMVQTAYTERDAALAKLAELEKQGPVAYQFQTIDGGWHPFLDEKHYLNTVEDGRWPIRALYLAPVPAKSLSEPEIKTLVNSIANGNGDIEYPNRFVFVSAIEAALKGGA